MGKTLEFPKTIDALRAAFAQVVDKIKAQEVDFLAKHPEFDPALGHVFEVTDAFVEKAVGEAFGEPLQVMRAELTHLALTGKGPVKKPSRASLA